MVGDFTLRFQQFSSASMSENRLVRQVRRLPRDSGAIPKTRCCEAHAPRSNRQTGVMSARFEKEDDADQTRKTKAKAQRVHKLAHSLLEGRQPPLPVKLGRGGWVFAIEGFSRRRQPWSGPGG